MNVKKITFISSVLKEIVFSLFINFISNVYCRPKKKTITGLSIHVKYIFFFILLGTIGIFIEIYKMVYIKQSKCFVCTATTFSCVIPFPMELLIKSATTKQYQKE